MDALRLSDVLARRGVLAPAEVVTLVVALALDLAELHAAGRSHGAVGVEAVGFDADGRPRLRLHGAGDAVLSPEVARGAVAGPAADVFGLAAIGYQALSGRPVWGTDDPDRACVRAAGGTYAPWPAAAPRRLVDALDAGLAGDPDERCDARELAERVLASGPAAPLRLPWPPQDHREMTAIDHGRSTSSTGRLVVTAMVMLVVAGVVTARGHGHKDQWTEVLATLDHVRSEAIAERQSTALLAVYAPGSPGLTRDTTLIDRLVRRGVTIDGHLAELTEPRLLHRTADTATLAAVERPAGYVLVDRHGRAVLRAGGTAARRVVVQLRRTDDGWRVVTVS